MAKPMFKSLKCVGYGLLLSAVLAPYAAAQTLTLLNDINFGKIEFAATRLAGQLQMGTNGVVTYGTNFTGNGTGTAGRIQIGGTTGLTASIRCLNTMVAVRSGAQNLTISPVKVSRQTPQTYAAGPNCRGLTTTAVTHVISATPSNNIIYLSGRLQTNNRVVGNGIYTTAGTGGTRGNVRVVYQ